MKKLCLFLPFLILIPVFYFSSCSKVDDYSDDKEKPTFSSVRFNVHDTVMVDGKKIILNDSTKVKKERIDTVIIGLGKWLRISANLKDNKNLSSFSVRMDTVRGEAIKEGEIGKDGKRRDSITFAFVKLGANIFKEENVTVRNHYLIQIPDSMTLQGASNYYHIREGLHKIHVKCIDMAGNADSTNHANAATTGDTLRIMLLRRKTFEDSLK